MACPPRKDPPRGCTPFRRDPILIVVLVMLKYMVRRSIRTTNSRYPVRCPGVGQDLLSISVRHPFPPPRQVGPRIENDSVQR